MSERSINDLPEGYVAQLELADGYLPTDKDEYMCDEHIEYFRRRIEQWKEELLKESNETIENLRSEARDVSDEAERASRETENTFELRTRDRYRKLLKKVNKALRRIESGDYGYCEETDEEIGLPRLIARPIATMCIDAQERWELKQKITREG
ncbi:RNA polymerase-binding protein DksA [Marinicella rhabdoformis]|uniref:RNA polymerase-binding protein DksA n=1 Tax=Marinicella rhabdoformis TaxID=2580566 RepID=UPI001FE4713B|nr:RNA polymerase-binding protein DksA [Marinicella rhabdoformis]